MTFYEARHEYALGELNEATVEQDPFVQFLSWLEHVIASETVDEPHAMTLATCVDGQPSARVVLLRGVDEHGFVFYTHYDSRKGNELDVNPSVALLFYWGPLERQVRIEGHAEHVPADQSDAYFRGRPHRSKLGAIASEQSSVLSSRAELEERMTQLESQYPEGSEVPRPDAWGGYRVIANAFEFWQGRPGRLHDRIRYRKNGDDWIGKDWIIERLAP